MNIIRKTKGENSYVAIIEVDKKFHVVSVNERKGQVSSFVPSDSPTKESGGFAWFGRFSNKGVKYVSSPRKRQNAMRLFRKYTKEL